MKGEMKNDGFFLWEERAVATTCRDGLWADLRKK
jgi:hypothetical protein